MFIGIEVYFWDLSSKRKTSTTVICGLHGSKIGSKVIPLDYVAIQVGELFMPNVTVPFSELTKNTQVHELKNLKGVIRIWSLKFFKLVCPQ
jgi:hypothetical protein